tara:strand:+ start:7239 stop:8198 length:960 start_codon:yes stop_codon:yes gene_type:complete
MVYNRSTKTAYIKKLYYSIVSYIKEYNKLPPTTLSKAARQYHINKLKYDGVIRKIGYGVWEADMDRFDQLKAIKKYKNSIGDGRNIRGHGFHYKIVFPEISNWGKRIALLDKKKILYKESKATWQGQRIIIKGYKCWLCNNSIVVYTPKGKSFYHYTAQDSMQSAFIDLISVLRGLESRLGIVLKFKGKYKVTTNKQHFGKINDSLAKEYNNKKRKLYIKQDGEYWLIIDNSFNLNELECVHPKTAKEDMDDGVVPFINSVRSNKGVTIDTLKDMIYGVTKNQLVFDSNMESHLNVLEKLGSAVDELRNEIKNLKRIGE